MMTYNGMPNESRNQLMFPPGFRFHPTDEELVLHYLCRKCTAMPIPVPVIAEIDLYKFDPWQLPGMALYGEKEWYFFSPRDRKYPNGSRPNRAAGTGYWKATGADKPIGNPKTLAIKKALVFYSGKAPKGEKTNWIMHEYRLAGVDRSARKKNPTLRLDDWVLCRIYNKKGAIGKQSNSEMKSARPKKTKPNPLMEPKLEFITHVRQSQPAVEYLCFDSSESLPKFNCGESSSSEEHVLSSSNLHDREAESEFRWDDDIGDWENALGNALMTEDITDNGLAPMSPFFPVQDMFFQYFEQPSF